MLLGLVLQSLKHIRGRRGVQQDQDGPVDPQNLGATALCVLVINHNSNRDPTGAASSQSES
jgi:hypothetical protein